VTTVCERVGEQLAASGYLGLVITHTEEKRGWRGQMALLALDRLKNDPRFLSGPLHTLHADIGEPRCEYRSKRGTLGKGSLQLVINQQTGKFWADVDKASPYDDVVGQVIHSGEVVWGFLKWIAGKD
jgi:hypothetical protein